MSVSMDGLVAPGARRMRAPLLDLTQVVVAARPRPTHILDLRAPQVQVAEQVIVSAPIAQIPSRLPLPPLSWLVSGTATAILVVGSAITVPRIIHNYQSRVKTPAAAQAAAPAASATASATTPKANVADESSALQSLVSQFAAGAGAPTFIVVKDLKTGATTTNSADTTLTSASLYKLFVAHGVYSEIDNGKWNLNMKVAGTSSTINECLTAMITVSDNTCGEALEAMLGGGGYDASLMQYGFSHTQFVSSPNQTSASDVALLLERLYKGTLLGPTSTEQFINLLKSQRINNRLPQGLPAGTAIAHKTGDLEGYVHDAGIVYGPKTDYLVVMMSGSWNSISNAPAKFAELSSKLYSQFNQ